MAQQSNRLVEHVSYFLSDGESMQHGLKQEEISQIPTTTQIPDGERCCICFEAMESARQLDCKHFFHNDCLLKWLEDNVTCPLCRKRLTNRPESSNQLAEDLVRFDQLLDRFVQYQLIHRSAGSGATTSSNNSDADTRAIPVDFFNQRRIGEYSPRPWDNESFPYATGFIESLMASTSSTSSNSTAESPVLGPVQVNLSDVQNETFTNFAISSIEEYSGISGIEEHSGFSGIEEYSGISGIEEHSEISDIVDEPTHHEVIDDPYVEPLSEEFYNEAYDVDQEYVPMYNNEEEWLEEPQHEEEPYAEPQWIQQPQVQEEWLTEYHQSPIYNPQMVPTYLPLWLPQSLPRHSTWLEPAGNGYYWRVDVDMNANVFLNMQQNAEFFPMGGDQVYYP